MVFVRYVVYQFGFLVYRVVKKENNRCNFFLIDVDKLVLFLKGVQYDCNGVDVCGFSWLNFFYG